MCFYESRCLFLTIHSFDMQISQCSEQKRCYTFRFDILILADLRKLKVTQHLSVKQLCIRGAKELCQSVTIHQSQWLNCSGISVICAPMNYD